MILYVMVLAEVWSVFVTGVKICLFLLCKGKGSQLKGHIHAHILTNPNPDRVQACVEGRVMFPAKVVPLSIYIYIYIYIYLFNVTACLKMHVFFYCFL